MPFQTVAGARACRAVVGHVMNMMGGEGSYNVFKFTVLRRETAPLRKDIGSQGGAHPIKMSKVYVEY